jgi:CRISPR-associated protein Cas5d
VVAAMNEGHGELALYIEDERQQRAGLLLRDVKYRLHAQMQLLSDEARANPGKYQAMFTRRARQGQCVNQPYLGCREFACHFRLIETAANGCVPDTEPAPIDWSADLGWMLYDLDFTSAADPRPQFFRAKMERGVLDLDAAEVRG